MRELELLAPARNADIGIAAIDCGADAVYIAGPRFGARQAAGNSIEDIAGLCRYAHRFGARIFVTLNTIIYDNELDDAASLIEEIGKAGADAVIVQDMAVVEMLRRMSPARHKEGQCHDTEVSGPWKGCVMPALHASTQCAIRTVERARELEALGFGRIVLEREMSLRQIREIASAVSCEIEFFVHGALCVCYSGQCYLSEKIAGRSANRGACIQACRSRYDLAGPDGRTIVKNKALLSLKDYNLISRMEDLADAGVMSFKIEGRLKNISYVRNTVRAYSLALDRIVGKSGGKYRRASFGRVSGGFSPDLGKTFNRGYTELFLDGKRGKWASMDSAKSMGEELGTVTGLNREKTSFAIRPAGSRRIILNNGDGLSFVGKDGNVEGVRADVCNGMTVRCKSTPALFEGAAIFRNRDMAFERELDSKVCIRRIPADITVSFGISPAADIPGPGNPDIPCASGHGNIPEPVLEVTATSEDGRTVRKTYSGIWNDMAANIGRMESMIRSQLSKSSGIYLFTVKDIVHDGSLPLLSASVLNSIRSDIAALLDSRPVIPDNRGGDRYFTPPDGSVQYDSPAILSETQRASKNVILSEAQETLKGVILSEAKDLPRNSPESLHPVPSGKTTELDYRANISNHLAEKLYTDAGCRVTEPAYELTHREGAELMRTRYCIRYELGLCPKFRHRTGKTDERTSASDKEKRNGTDATPLYLLNNGQRFTVLFDCRSCEMVIK